MIYNYYYLKGQKLSDFYMIRSQMRQFCLDLQMADSQARALTITLL